MPITTSERLSELLQENSLTAVAFARKVNVSFSIASEWIRENTPIKLSNLLKIASFFGCSVDFICGRTDTPGQFIPTTPTFPTPFLTLIEQSGEKKTKVFHKLGMNRHAIYDWKKGFVPLSSTLITIADYFSVTIDYLIGIEDVTTMWL